MKIPVKHSSLVLLSILAIGQATAAPLGFLEKFAISENREDALKELIPGTREYYYYHALHAQNQGDAQELKRIIGRYTLTGCTQQLWRLASWVFVLGSRLSVLQGIVHSLTRLVCSCIPTCPFRAGLMTKRPDKFFL